MNKKTNELLKQIEKIKQQLVNLGDMRPGTLSKQYYKRGDKQWPYWQISYTFNKKSKTEYVRDEYLKTVKDEISEYQLFKKLIEKWTELSLSLSKERMKIFKQLQNTRKS